MQGLVIATLKTLEIEMTNSLHNNIKISYQKEAELFRWKIKRVIELALSFRLKGKFAGLGNTLSMNVILYGKCIMC